MIDISQLSDNVKKEIAQYIREDSLKYVNEMVEQVQIRDSFYTRYGKRCMDVALSTIALIVTLPINLIIAVITFFDVGRPILFQQMRIGKKEKPFYIVKFRNMTNETDTSGELLPPSQRITKWGRIVRKTSMDELLNFWSIFKGDMSLVGPRPLLPVYLERLNKRDRQRYGVKPGLECPPRKTGAESFNWEGRMENDIWYVENCSFWVDMMLIFRIVQIAFDRKSVAARSSASHGGFLGYDKSGAIITTKAVPEKYYQMYLRNHGLEEITEHPV